MSQAAHDEHATGRWNRRQAVRFLATLFILAGVLALYTRFLAWNESRPGPVLDDPLLRLLPTIDASTLIFAVIYGALLFAVMTRLREPDVMLMTMRAYTLLMLARIAAMYLVPLDPPTGMAMLHDPIARIGAGAAMQRDLFFSGHTATLFLLALTARAAWHRYALLAATFAVAVLVLLQHCHYTIDVVAAFGFAYACRSAALRLPG